MFTNLECGTVSPSYLHSIAGSAEGSAPVAATYLTHSELAAHYNNTVRTIYSWHERGLIEGFDDDGTIKFHLEAVDLAMRMNPRAMRDGRRRGRGVVKPMPVRAEVVDR
ncbi:hypothetical protein AB6V29_02585 [Microbacterium sp. 20-116]|uniref:hypothetical protein n=1 Tax=Microbacterium sp. 20-116 TaxID=3239883 RepID=UPI0034E22254